MNMRETLFWQQYGNGIFDYAGLSEVDVVSVLLLLHSDAMVYVQNKNEFNKWVGVTNNLRSLATNAEFTISSLADSDGDVKSKNRASQVPDTNAPSRNVRNELASTPVNSVTDGSYGVKQQFHIANSRI